MLTIVNIQTAYNERPCFCILSVLGGFFDHNEAQEDIKNKVSHYRPKWLSQSFLQFNFPHFFSIIPSNWYKEIICQLGFNFNLIKLLRSIPCHLLYVFSLAKYWQAVLITPLRKWLLVVKSDSTAAVTNLHTGSGAWPLCILPWQ